MEEVSVDFQRSPLSIASHCARFPVKIKFFSLVQSENADSPMDTTLIGMLIWVNPEQEENAFDPMLFKLDES